MLGVLQGVLHASSESHCCFGGKKRERKMLVFWGGMDMLLGFSSFAYLGSCLTEVEAAC